MDDSSTDLQTNTAIGRQQLLQFQQEVLMTHTSDEELLDSEKALIKDAIKTCPELIALVNDWKSAVDQMFKNAEIVRNTENKIRDIIKEIYHKAFPNRKQYHGVIDVVRDVFHEEILGWKLLANGKHDPKIWDVYPLTGERKGPTKFNPKFEFGTQGKQINELITRVQSSLNKASKSAITKNLSFLRQLSVHNLRISSRMILVYTLIGMTYMQSTTTSCHHHHHHHHHHHQR